VVAEAIAGGATTGDAAAKGQVSRASVARWLKNDPAFTDLIVQIRAGMVDRATGRLSEIALSAVETLETERKAGESSSDRIRAAQAILVALLRFGSQVDLEARVAALERAAGPDAAPIHLAS
jgi:hypothetical protein